MSENWDRMSKQGTTPDSFCSGTRELTRRLYILKAIGECWPSLPFGRVQQNSRTMRRAEQKLVMAQLNWPSAETDRGHDEDILLHRANQRKTQCSIGIGNTYNLLIYTCVSIDSCSDMFNSD